MAAKMTGGLGLGGKAGGKAGAKRAPSRKGGTAPPIQAMQLLGRWSRVAQGHIGFGGGCACSGAEFCNLQAKDMEQHILDYIDSKYRAAGASRVCALLAERAGYKQSESGSIAELLRAIATEADPSIPEAQQVEVLADLGRSIESLDDALRNG
jgi:hypothetical protein